MQKHIPRCDKNPNKRGTQVEFTPLQGMEEMKLAVETKRATKAHNIRWAYGLDMDTFDRMMAEQKGLCAICGRPPDGLNRRTNSLHVDHDHVTHQIRMLLCHHCNLGLGAFKDDPALLLAAIDYLRRFKPLELVS